MVNRRLIGLEPTFCFRLHLCRFEKCFAGPEFVGRKSHNVDKIWPAAWADSLIGCAKVANDFAITKLGKNKPAVKADINLANLCWQRLA
jgi:hypothetical protein